MELTSFPHKDELTSKAGIIWSAKCKKELELVSEDKILDMDETES